jgi:hypothetical protein
MKLNLVRHWTAATFVAALAVQAPPSLAQAPFTEDDMRRMVDGLRDGTLSVAYASGECRRSLEDDPAGKGLEQVMATFLEVPEDLALSAFCRALVQAIKAGELSADGLMLVSRDGRDPATALEIGRILRATYFSHVVTTTASAEGSKPR